MERILACLCPHEVLHFLQLYPTFSLPSFSLLFWHFPLGETFSSPLSREEWEPLRRLPHSSLGSSSELLFRGVSRLPLPHGQLLYQRSPALFLPPAWQLPTHLLSSTSRSLSLSLQNADHRDTENHASPSALNRKPSPCFFWDPGPGGAVSMHWHHHTLWVSGICIMHILSSWILMSSLSSTSRPWAHLGCWCVMLSSYTQPSLVFGTTLMGSLVSDPPRDQAPIQWTPFLQHAHPCLLILTLPLFLPHGPEQRLPHKPGAQYRPVFTKGPRICFTRSQESSQWASSKKSEEGWEDRTGGEQGLGKWRWSSSTGQCQHSQGLVGTRELGLGSEWALSGAQAGPVCTQWKPSAPRSLPGPHPAGLPWEIKAALTCLK